MKLKIIFLPIVFLCALTCVFAVERNSSNSSPEELKEIIDSLLRIKPDNYFSQIDTYLNKIDKHILHRRGICSGDFSVVEIEENSGEKVEKRRKLSRSERRLCLSELKNLRILYVNNLFIARKKYLDYLHDKRVKQLIKIKEDVLKEIQRGTSKRR